MDDTSVAILASANGDKHLFFQENSGSIRQALYDPSSEEWTSDVNNMVVTNAKNGTPIVAFQSNTKGSTKGGLGKTVSSITSLLDMANFEDLVVLHSGQQLLSKPTIRLGDMDYPG